MDGHPAAAEGLRVIGGVWLHMIAALTLIFALVIAVIVTQPYDDSPIRSFFAPSASCAAPCFLGIHPGTTSSDQAQTILQSTGWIDEFDADDEVIDWTWNGQQPVFLSDSDYNEITLDQGTVETIDIGTGMDMATVQLAFGKPDMWLSLDTTAFVSRHSTETVIYVDRFALYNAYHMEIIAIDECPLANGLWGVMTHISFPMLDDHTEYTPSTGVMPPLPEDCA